MANHKHKPLEKKVPVPFALSRKTKIALERHCEENGFNVKGCNKSTLVEELILNYLESCRIQEKDQII